MPTIQRALCHKKLFMQIFAQITLQKDRIRYQVFYESFEQKIVEIHFVSKKSSDVFRLHPRSPVLDDDVRSVERTVVAK